MCGTYTASADESGTPERLRLEVVAEQCRAFGVHSTASSDEDRNDSGEGHGEVAYFLDPLAMFCS
jgi:hypothetical protein